MTTRRNLILGASTALLGCTLGGRLMPAQAKDLFGALGPALARIETEIGGRLGVAVLDTHTGAEAGHRPDERFPMCSTFKLLATAAVLSRVDAGQDRLDRRIRFEAADIVTNSPVTKEHVGGDGMALAELCEAAMTWSDNTAANLLLRTLGGPSGITAYARALGDQSTRLDRIEPELNEALPGDPRDTTTPAAMLANLRTLVLGEKLSPASRAQFTGWLLGNKTGDTRLRAGLPKDWRVGDKTGTGERGTANDVGFAWPPGRAPVVISVYLTGSEAPGDQRNAAHAAVGQAIAEALAG